MIMAVILALGLIKLSISINKSLKYVVKWLYKPHGESESNKNQSKLIPVIA